MSTESQTKTRLPVWARKFRRWSSQQKLHDGLVKIIQEPENLSWRLEDGPWVRVLNDYTQRMLMSVTYNPVDCTISVRAIGRNRGDVERTPLPEVGKTAFYESDAWPGEYTQTYQLAELPSDLKEFVRRRTFFMN